MTEAQVNAREVRARLWNPPGGRASSELDIVPEWAFRRRQATAIIEARRAQQDFERRASLEKALRDAVAEHTRAKEIARALLEEEGPKIIGVSKILAAVSRYTGISTVDIRSGRKTAPVVRPRQIVMYLAREYTLRSLPDIGRRLGDRDHTTILHGHRKIKSLIEAGDVRLAADIDNIKWELGIV